MAFNKITNSDLNGKGVVGLADTPGLSTSEMQRKFDEIAKEVIVPKYNGLVDELNGNGVANNSKVIDPVDGTEKTLQIVVNDVKGYVDTKKAEAVTEANIYTDGKTVEAKAYADNKSDNALVLAKEYANDKETSTKAYADSVGENTLDSAKEYADSVSETAKTEAISDANDYTDEKVARFDKIEEVTETLIGTNNVIPTGKAVADALGKAGYGDMLKSTYDKNNDGKVDDADHSDNADNATNSDNADKLNNHTEDYFASKDWVDGKIIEKTWAEFIVLKETGNLIPGKYYKITDRGIDFLMEANRIGCDDAEGNRSNVQTQLDKSFDEIAKLKRYKIEKEYTSNGYGVIYLTDVPNDADIVSIESLSGHYLSYTYASGHRCIIQTSDGSKLNNAGNTTSRIKIIYEYFS